ncbi:hypothetical protein [Pseudonocardia lacus]|uniref:hypothetical protein n=1 Tax=Pseudonocardia lacus TaxID=2835865 RepID=UPI001BDBF9BB|nr:hypothetical protein [Pseudonocardia lacus]
MKRLVVLCGIALIVPVLVVVSEFRERSPLQFGLTEAGCRGVSVRHGAEGPRAVLTVSVHDCLDEVGRAVPAAEAWDRVVRVAWETTASRFDGVLVTVFRTSEDPGSVREATREFSSSEMEAKWGPRPVVLDWVLPDPRREEWVWLVVLPAVILAIGVPIAAGVDAARRGVSVWLWRS